MRPTYQEYTEYKRLTPKQHEKWMKKYEEEYGVKLNLSGEIVNEIVREELVEKKERKGVCKKCGCGGFELRTARTSRGVGIERTCKDCGDKSIV